MRDIPVYIGENAISALLEYCEKQNLSHFFLVADGNTYAALGQRVEAAMQAHHLDVQKIVFDDPQVVPDEAFITQVLLQADQVERTYLAVGSGTLTDITRFVSHRTRRPFISLPTAPSVDGYTSPSASLVIGKIKQTVMAQLPMAVFADLGTLSGAPQPLIAAGYGDMLGKAIALADWPLGHLLWGEPYRAEIAQRVRETLNACIEATVEIGQASTSGVEKLMFSLIDSGFCMVDFGNSRPAAGAEHYMSHFLEMKLLQEGRPAVLHGAKVGLCSMWAAELYGRLRHMERAEVANRLQMSTWSDRAAEERRIRTIYGPIADKLLVEQAPFLDLSPEAFAQLKQRILDHWDEIQAIASEVPAPEWFSDHLAQVGGATQPAGLGLSDDEVQQAYLYSHYLRNRFTICKLGNILGLVNGV
jgi:glycerol-1-phosphate dehydrogenase [NAD(P)+]